MPVLIEHDLNPADALAAADGLEVFLDIALDIIGDGGGDGIAVLRLAGLGVHRTQRHEAYLALGEGIEAVPLLAVEHTLDDELRALGHGAGESAGFKQLLFIMTVADAAVAAEVYGLYDNGVLHRVELRARRGIGEIIVIRQRRAEGAGEALEIVLIAGEVPCLGRAVARQTETAAQLHAHLKVKLAYAADDGVDAFLAALGFKSVEVAGVYHPVFVAYLLAERMLRLVIVGDDGMYAYAFGIAEHFAGAVARAEHQ